MLFALFPNNANNNCNSNNDNNNKKQQKYIHAVCELNAREKIAENLVAIKATLRNIAETSE